MNQDPSKPGTTRRTVIKTMAAGAGGAALGIGGARWALPVVPPPQPVWRFLTPAEAAAVIAIAEQIIPADSSPGATDAGVVNFIDKQLAGFYQRHQQSYRDGIAALQATCSAMHGKPFEELPWETQTSTLHAMEAGKLPRDAWTKVSQSSFFRLLRDHSMQGFYGSPKHGGNRDYVSYRMMEIDYPLIIGQNRYQDGAADKSTEATEAQTDDQ